VSRARLLALGAAALLAGCGAGSPDRPNQAAALALDGAPGALDAGIALAVARDYTGAEGVALTVRPVRARGGALRDFSDQVRQREDASAVVLASADEGKVALVVNLDNSLAELDAVKIVRELGPIIGGGGGGRPTLAEAGGKNVDAVRDALEAGRDRLAAALA